MARRRHRGRRAAQPEGVLGPALRPIAWSALLGAAATAAFAAPAYADPSTTSSVPDPGSRPVPSGALPLPNAESFTAPIGQQTPLSGLANEITAAETELSTIGEQLKELGIQLSELRSARVLADYQWRQAGDVLRVAQDRAHKAASKAFKDAAGMPPGLSDLYGLGALSGVTDDSSAASEAAARDVSLAQEAERAAHQAYLDALNAERSAVARFSSLQATYKQREAALLELKRRHASQLATIEREIEANEQRLGAAFIGGDSIAGMKASAKALAAVTFALRQLGKPYLWGAEGPDRYDCSGLMWASYRSTGVTLPRVAKDQYYATRMRSVSRYALLPGDLLFFSSSSDWTGIHHVGMYLGNGKMIHAPTTGDVVKISTVWWSRFFAATRVYGAVTAPGTPAPPPTPTRPSPTPTTPSPTPTTPSPTPTTPSPTPTTPSPTPTTPSPTPTTPSPTPTTSSASPSAAAPATSTAAPQAPAPSPTDTTAAAPAASTSTEPTGTPTSTPAVATSTSGT
jgi:peptidoglycan DL-endopeptidase CwlO